MTNYIILKTCHISMEKSTSSLNKDVYAVQILIIFVAIELLFLFIINNP